MTPTQELISPTTTSISTNVDIEIGQVDFEQTPLRLPDHTQLPETDGSIVQNFQELPQSILLTQSIWQTLENLHPDQQFCVGQDSGIYWQITDPPLNGCKAPDWYYVANVPPMLDGQIRRSYVLWQELIAPTIAIEFVSGNGSEERDRTPFAGKFWVYEQAIRIPFYAIYEVKKASVEVYHLIEGRYQIMSANEHGRYPISSMGVELGISQGLYHNLDLPWLRWWDAEGNFLLAGDERAFLAESIVQQETQRADQETQRADQETQRADQETQRADQETQRADQETQRADQETQQKERLAAYLRSIGVNPDEV